MVPFLFCLAITTPAHLFFFWRHPFRIDGGWCMLCYVVNLFNSHFSSFIGQYLIRMPLLNTAGDSKRIAVKPTLRYEESCSQHLPKYLADLTADGLGPQ
jgi:hypothetical protein